MKNSMSSLELEIKQLSDFLESIKKEKWSDLFIKNFLNKLLKLKNNQLNQFKKITGGYSNDTYHYPKKNLVFRFPKISNPLARHLVIEVHNLIQAKLLGLTPLNVVAFYEKYALLITSFIPNYQSYSAEQIKNLSELSAAAHLIKRVHYSDLRFKRNSETAISFIDASSETFEKIKPILKQKDYLILQKLQKIMIYLSHFNIYKRPSHGDFHHFNIIKLNNVLQLMDWELSSVEDPAFDISRFFCVSNLDKGEKFFFLQAYKNTFNVILSEADMKNLKMRIQLFEPINYFSIVIWAKYVISSFSGIKKEILKETISNYTQKTLNTLAHIDLSTINQNIFIETNPSCANQSFAFFRVGIEKSKMKQDEFILDNNPTTFKNVF